MPFNGLGFSGGGFGRTQSNTAPLNQYVGALGATAQQVGVAQYGSVWASNNCPSCGTAIQEMQALINKVGAQLGAGVSIAVDGKVGTGTVSALRQVATVAAGRGSPLAAVLAAYSTPEMVAKNADTIRNALMQISSAAPATAPTPIATYPSSGNNNVVQTSTSPTATVITPPSIPGASASPGIMPAGASKTPYIIGGLILAVGIGAAIVILRAPS